MPYVGVIVASVLPIVVGAGVLWLLARFKTSALRMRTIIAIVVTVLSLAAPTVLPVESRTHAHPHRGGLLGDLRAATGGTSSFAQRIDGGPLDRLDLNRVPATATAEMPIVDLQDTVGVSRNPWVVGRDQSRDPAFVNEERDE